MAQVLAHGKSILQHGHVVEAVRMEYSICGGKYDVSPQQSMKAGGGGQSRGVGR